VTARLIVAAALAASASGCGAKEPPVQETPLYADVDAGAGGERGAAVGDAIARWTTAEGGRAAHGADAVSAERARSACLSGAIDTPLPADEMARIVGAAIEGLLGAPRFVERRVRAGLWEGDVLKVNAAEDDGRGGRKIWLGDGQLSRQVESAEGGRTRRITVRSSVENPQLVADEASSQRRDIVVLEVAARYAVGGAEVIALVDATAQLAAVVRRAGGEWRFDRAVDLAGIDDTREALCRAVTAN
jgi:hypothetical protein